MKSFKISILLLVCLAMVGCSLLNLTRKDLTEDEKARIALDTGITSLDVGFTAGNIAIMVKPEYAPLWKSSAIPSFSFANKVALDFIGIGESGGTVTEAQVVSTLQARAFEILALIATWETNLKEKPATKSRDVMKAKSTKAKATTKDTTVDITYPPIPTYAQLRTKSTLLQAKLDAVK